MGRLRGRILCGVAGAAVVGLLLCLFIETDRQRIEKLIEAAREAAAKGDADRVMAQVDPAYSYRGMDFALLRTEVAGGLRRFRPDRVQLFDPRLTLSGETAKFETSVMLVPPPASQMPTTEFKVTLGLTKRGGRWYVSAVDEGE